jgi:hypothetical protein
MVQLYNLLDACGGDDEIVETLSLDGLKVWLADFWNSNPDEEMDEKEHDEWIQEILASTESELFSRMGGVGYYFEEVDEME